MKRRHIAISVVGAAVLAIALAAWSGALSRLAFAPTGFVTGQGTTMRHIAGNGSADAITTVAEDLRIPWEMVFLPDGDMLVTERVGTIRRIGAHPAVYRIAETDALGEGGLLGMALHPDFATNGWIYLYRTGRVNGEISNAVERHVYDGEAFAADRVILGGLPGARFHDGGRIAFGPDGMLYVTVGDAGDSASAQDPSTHNGTILRMTDEGDIPPDNASGSRVWSYGHRNPQGIAWDAAGRLWSTEHGRSGITTGMDEVNRIVESGNYGWPDIEGDARRQGMMSPVAHSGADETWAPADLLIHDGYLYFTGLRGESLYRAEMHDDGTLGPIVAHFRDDFGRLRGVRIGPDGFLYLSTSNGDGRGNMRPGDDRILRIDPSVFGAYGGDE